MQIQVPRIQAAGGGSHCQKILPADGPHENTPLGRP